MPPVLKATITPGPWAEPIPPISVVESCGDMPSLAHEYDIRGEVVFARIGGIILPDVIREFYARFYSDRHWNPALPMIVDWRLVRSVPTQLEIVAMAAILSRIHPPVPARHAFIAKDDAAAATWQNDRPGD